MRIAQVAPLTESVPPRLYGGTERIVSYLTEELVALGHEVTLFASGDSRTSARLRPMCKGGLRLNPGYNDPIPHHLLMVEYLLQDADSFDIVHFHCDYLHFSAFRRQATPSLTTLHGRLDLPDIAPLYQEFSDVALVSISQAQRAPLQWLNWRGTIYHGLPRRLLSFDAEGGDYLIFLGRICPEKRLDRAIEIARGSGMPLKVAAKVDAADAEYFEQVIAPMLDDPLVDFLGEVGDAQKNELLGGARAHVFPIDWPEPFGLTMIEAMACGTPVIAYLAGSVAEVVDHGVTGLIVDDLQQAIRAVDEVGALDRRRIRRTFERRFTARRMAEDYVKIYEDLIDQGTTTGRRLTFPLAVGRHGGQARPAVRPGAEYEH